MSTFQNGKNKEIKIQFKELGLQYGQWFVSKTKFSLEKLQWPKCKIFRKNTG